MSGKSPSTLAPRAARLLRVVWRGALLCGIWLVADAASRYFALPMSGGVLGLLAVVVLLLAGWLPLGTIKLGAEWLLAEMLLFFVPAVVAIIKYIELFRHEGVRLVAVIVLGTVMVMIATAVAVDWAWRAERYLLRRRLAVRRCAAGAQGASAR